MKTIGRSRISNLGSFESVPYETWEITWDDKNTASCQTNNVSQALKQKGLKEKKTEFEKLLG